MTNKWSNSGSTSRVSSPSLSAYPPSPSALLCPPPNSASFLPAPAPPSSPIQLDYYPKNVVDLALRVCRRVAIDSEVDPTGFACVLWEVCFPSFPDHNSSVHSTLLWSLPSLRLRACLRVEKFSRKKERKKERLLSTVEQSLCSPGSRLDACALIRNGPRRQKIKGSKHTHVFW